MESRTPPLCSARHAAVSPSQRISLASRRHPTSAAASDRAWLGWNVRLRVAKHHDRVARGAHEVITLLVHPAILAMVKPVFVEPIGKVLENLEAPALHPNQHVL